MKLAAYFLIVPLLFTSCSSLPGGSGGTVERVLAGLGCITALANAGVQVAGDPAVNGAHTVLDVLAAIASVGASNVPSSVLAACKATIDYATKDLSGAVGYIHAATGTTAAKAMRPAAVSKVKPTQPVVPTVVTVPLPK